jgi:hydrocephalus-inducing protein
MKIVARFSSKNELKLRTENNTTDLTCEILEGKTMELFKPVPINIHVNSVYNKYSI